LKGPGAFRQESLGAGRKVHAASRKSQRGGGGGRGHLPFTWGGGQLLGENKKKKKKQSQAGLGPGKTKGVQKGEFSRRRGRGPEEKGRNVKQNGRREEGRESQNKTPPELFKGGNWERREKGCQGVYGAGGGTLRGR